MIDKEAELGKRREKD